MSADDSTESNAANEPDLVEVGRIYTRSAWRAREAIIRDDERQRIAATLEEVSATHRAAADMTIHKLERTKQSFAADVLHRFAESLGMRPDMEDVDNGVNEQALNRLLGGMYLRAMGDDLDAEQAAFYHSGNISHARLEALCMAAMDDTVFAAVVQHRARLKRKSS